jgi:hypothetical protein
MDMMVLQKFCKTGEQGRHSMASGGKPRRAEAVRREGDRSPVAERLRRYGGEDV